MDNYLMQMQSFIGGIPWEYRFEMASDEMAKAYVAKYIRQGNCLPSSCRTVILWGIDPERVVAEFGYEVIHEVKELAR